MSFRIPEPYGLFRCGGDPSAIGRHNGLLPTAHTGQLMEFLTAFKIPDADKSVLSTAE
jgi:hypothetical protein